MIVNGTALFLKTIFLYSKQFSVIIYCIVGECGEIGRHDGLKIRCSKMRGGSSPPVPIKIMYLTDDISFEKF